jgi:hypothetical protein
MILRRIAPAPPDATFRDDTLQTEWLSGGWKRLAGTYMPNRKGTDFVVVHTKRDPENHRDGTLRCVTLSSPSTSRGSGAL